MESVWTDSVKNNNLTFPALAGEHMTDVLIIGGGLAGILCAEKLHEAGVDYKLIEQGKIGQGNSCNTTGKITAQHGLIYSDLTKKYGSETAFLYYEANHQAVNEYQSLSKTYDFDFEQQNSFVFSKDNRKKLEAEAKIYDEYKIPYILNDNANIPAENIGALGMEFQAQMNVMKLIYALAPKLNIHENTKAVSVDGLIVKCDNGEIIANKIIYATHFPFSNIKGLYFLKMYQSRSYTIAIENAAKLDGMYIDECETGLSLRNYQNYLIICGGDHKTGKNGGRYDELSQIAKKHYKGSRIAFRWSAQDCMSLDSRPYIGFHRSSDNNVFVLTGFNKWGLSGSMVGAILIKDLIVHAKSKFEKVFDPSRSIMKPQLFVNAGNAAVGLAHLSKRCPHMGCKMKWNSAEFSWDCVCHGSRFDKAGNILDNPAKKKLKVKLKKSKEAY